MKRIVWILLGLCLSVNMLYAQDVTYRRALRVDQGWSATFFDNTAFDGNAQDTSAAFYVGDIYLPSITWYYKGDDNVDTVGTAGDSLDVNLSPDFWIPGVGWVTQDHNLAFRMDDVTWKIRHDRAPPRIIATSVANPDSGVDFTTTTSTNVDDVVYSVALVLTTSSTVANRYVKIGFKDSNGNVIAIAQSSTAQPASKTIAYSFFQNTGGVYSDNTSLVNAPLPPDLRLRYGSEIYSVVTNIDSVAAGGRDQISAITINSLRDADILAGYHSPIMADSIRVVADAQADNGSDVDIYLVATGMYLRAD